MAQLEVMVTGVTIVMGVLTLLWALTALVGAATSGASKAGNLARNRRSRSKQPDGAIPPHHLVAIAAAVSEVIGAPHRIVRVTAPAHRTLDWSGQTRMRQQPGTWIGFRAAGRGKAFNRMGEP
jgi:glutaconyl-CoA/methylmalonyl-CoA decarboxylase subunit delta